MADRIIIGRLTLAASFFIPLILILWQYDLLTMSAGFKNVIIIGAGGNLGPSILNAFLNDGTFNVSVLSRQESKSTFPAGVKVNRADYSSQESLTNAFKGQDVVLSIVGGTAFGDQNNYIDAAIAAGVKRFIPSEYGSNTVNDKVRAIVPVFNAKKGAVDYLKSKEGSIEWSSVITGPFFDWGVKVGFLGLAPATKTATTIDGGNITFSSTNLDTIGRTVVAALKKPAETKNQYIFVSGFQTTQKDVIAAAEKITGEKWTVNDVKSSDLIATGNDKLKKGDFSGIADLIKGSAWGDHGLGDFSSEGLWNDKLGIKEHDFEESVKAGLSGKLVHEK